VGWSIQGYSNRTGGIFQEGVESLSISKEKNQGDSLPERLQELRATMHYSQAHVADQMHISRQTYSHYETGRIVPPADMLCQLADIFHVSVDVLLGHETPDTSEEADDSEPDTSDYLKFVTAPENLIRFKSLSSHEKKVLFYFTNLGKRDQQDLLDFMKIKWMRVKKGCKS